MLRNGEDTGIKLCGYVVEKQFEVGQFYFLIINYDCPFEEQTDLVLLNDKFKPICRRCLIPFNYASWNFKEYECLGGDECVLTFYEGLVLNIKILSNNRPWFKRRISMKNISKNA